MSDFNLRNGYREIRADRPREFVEVFENLLNESKVDLLQVELRPAENDVIISNVSPPVRIVFEDAQ